MLIACVVMWVAALLCLVAGVFLLAGAGWALLAASVCLAAAAGVMLRGLLRVAEGEGRHARA